MCMQRPDSVKVDALDINGARFEVNLSALPARVFQHEFDHLEVLFISINVEAVFSCTFPELWGFENSLSLSLTHFHFALIPDKAFY